jgi:putative ABC transport system permease protein
MIVNYFKIALRQLKKNKAFSLINILGLSVGVACCTLLALFIQDELSYEKHIKDYDRVYRMYTTFTNDGKSENFPRVSPPIAIDLGELLPEVEVAARMVYPPEVQQHLIRYGAEQFYEKNGALVDTSFFDIFPFPFLEGDPATALDLPASVVITEDLSKKIFRNKSGIDELIIINSGRTTDTFRITGVLKKIPQKSHADVAFYMSMKSGGWGEYMMTETTWAWNNFVVGYLKLKPGTFAANVEEKLPALLDERAGAILKNAGMAKELHIQALDDIRLYSDFSDSFGDVGQGSITYIYILGSIGVFILLIACINFMNLTTAKASQRAGEVGIRKSMGAHRTHLIKQFMGESFTIVAISLMLAALIVILALPLMNEITQKNLELNSTNLPTLVLAMLAIGLTTGLLAGSYPAFFLSSFQPARVLKGKALSSDGSSWLRKGLVVFQFVITITLISSIVVIQQQLSFIKDKSLGFNEDATIMLPLRTGEASRAYNAMKADFTAIPGVRQVSATSSLPSTPLFQDFALFKEGELLESGSLHRVVYVDENYFELMGIELLAGRDVTFPADTFTYFNNFNKIIVNEASLNLYGLTPENAIGTRLMSDIDNNLRTHEIIGVIRNFHQFSLHQPIVPMLFAIPANQNRFSFVAVATEGDNYKAINSQLEATWKKYIDATPFESQPLTDSISLQYEADNRVNMMLTLSTILAIVISCLGLYGLSIFVAERKLKEIGIRKVLGASVTGIVQMLSMDFIKLVMVAFVIAVPLGYFLMNKWLQGFEYKIEIGFLVFLVAGIVSFLIAWITVGFESVKAAFGNPVNALRNE